MATRIWLRTMLLVMMAVFVTGCCMTTFSSLNEFRPIESSDLVGTWKADYDRYFTGNNWSCYGRVTGVETITLRADGVYQQVYNDGQGYVYTSPWNRWYFGGRTLRLEGGRFYPLGIEDAERLANGQLYYHSNDDGTGRPLDLDSTTGIVLHAWPRSGGGIVLQYPPVCDLDAPIFVEFQPVISEHIVTVSP